MIPYDGTRQNDPLIAPMKYSYAFHNGKYRAI